MAVAAALVWVGGGCGGVWRIILGTFVRLSGVFAFSGVARGVRENILSGWEWVGMSGYVCAV